MTLPLRPEVFTILRALIEERIGLSYAYADRELLADKLSPRAMEAGFDSLLDYYYFLRYDPNAQAELDALADSLVVGETYFFRELEQLATLVSEFIVPWVDAGLKPRIWSAACATGEEPLTLAMLLSEAGVLERTEIVASDISRSFIERARRGQHTLRALRQAPPRGLDERFLERADSGRVRARPELIAAIDWRRVNLADPGAVRELGRFQAIICRNVLIYFSDETTLRVLQSLHDQLDADGALLVGVSESLLRFGSNLVFEERKGSFFYRKAK